MELKIRVFFHNNLLKFYEKRLIFLVKRDGGYNWLPHSPFLCIKIIQVSLEIRQFNNIDFSSEVSTVHKFVYTDEALLLLVRQ